MQNQIKSKDGSTVEIIQLNKEICERLLESVPEFQRKRNQVNLNKIYDALEKGEWRFNGESIIVDNQDRLINGQHRIFAFLQKNFFPEVIMVKINTDSFEAFSTMDCGKSRSISEVFKSNGIKNSTNTSTITSMVYSFKQGRHPKRGCDSNYNSILNFYNENSEKIQNSLSVGMKMKDLSMVCQIGFCSYILTEAGFDIKGFVDGLTSMINLSQAQANYHKVLLNNSRRIRGKMNAEDHIKTFLYHFKCHTEGLKGDRGNYSKFCSEKNLMEAFDISLNMKNEKKELAS